MRTTHLHDQHDDSAARAVEYAGDAYAAIRALNHLTIGGPPLPAPTVYAVLGRLGPTGQGLNQALHQIAAALAASVHAYDLYEDDGGDPTTSISRAHTRLTDAAAHAHRVAELLDQAQTALNQQGYRHKSPGGPS
ncbi:MAG: hypothetical protein ACRDUV_03975 [Pseudonocardiaceae bacterium]